MDETRFDAVARGLAIGSRRRFLVKIAAAAVGLVGTRQADARTCSQPGRVCREHANCCTGLCGKGSNGRLTCQCRNDADCPATGSSCRVAVCKAGVCGTETVVPVVSLAACQGRCHTDKVPASVVLCGQELTCPDCDSCEDLGCPGGAYGGTGPVGHATYCTASDEPVANCPEDCAEGAGCVGTCIPICIG
jgi:hypothetical protein